MTNALEVRGLRKSYGEKAVLKGIDLSVGRGDIFALLGVNGAGKTTALACIEGLRKYDGGTISVSGRIGIQLQSAALPAHIKGAEAVELFARWNRKTADASMLAALDTGSIAGKRYQEMSTGQKRRLHLALAPICDPDIGVLDGPTAGRGGGGAVAPPPGAGHPARPETAGEAAGLEAGDHGAQGDDHGHAASEGHRYAEGAVHRGPGRA